MAQALAEVRQLLGNAQRLATEAQRAGVQTTMTSTGQVDPRVMNQCPTFSGRDTDWSEFSFIFESVAAIASLEPAMEGAFSGLAEKPCAELTPGMKLSAKQLYYLLVNTVKGKALTLVRCAENVTTASAVGKRFKSEYQPVAGRHTAMLMGIMQLGWDSRRAANTQEYEGERLENFSDSMKIAVLASHTLQSIQNVIRLAAGPAGKYRVVRQNMSVFSLDVRQKWSRSGVGSHCKCDTDGRRRRWQKAKERDAVRTSQPCERLQAQGEGKDQSKGKTQEHEGQEQSHQV